MKMRLVVVRLVQRNMLRKRRHLLSKGLRYVVFFTVIMTYGHPKA